MSLPFGPEQFFQIFVDYNQIVWPMQWVLNGLGVAVVILLARGGKASMRGVAAGLAVLWLWSGIAYHLAFFTSINPAAWVFGAMFVTAGLAFGGRAALTTGVGEQEAAAPLKRFGWLLIGYAMLIYPVLGYVLGHRYPATPTFGLPCPLTIFTIGVLTVAGRAFPAVLLGMPLIWTVVGSVAAFALGVLQDLGLLVAGIGALLDVWRRRGARPGVAS